MTDLRDAFFEAFIELSAANKKIVLLSIDMGSQVIKSKSHLLGERYINVGVSEQNAVSLAAGLASQGFIPFVYGISSFLVNRPRAQIRHDAIIANNNINLIGSGPGLAYDLDGPSHHCLDDIQLMRSLPGIKIYSPFDAETAALAVQYSVDSNCSTYCRLDKGTYPPRSKSLINIRDLYIKPGDPENWIVSSGVVAHKIEEDDGRSEMVVLGVTESTGSQIADVIPDNATISVNEEAHISGGILSLIAEANLLQNKKWTFAGVKFKNKFVQEKWPRDKLFELYCDG
jgi:transketolase